MDSMHVHKYNKMSSFKKKFKKNLNKNQSVKLYREKQKKRVVYTEIRDSLRKRYEEVNTSEIEKFNQLPLTGETLRGLKKCNYTTLTEIQQQAILPALKGLDILGAAKTGSGKTLAFVVPILERLFCEGWSRSDGLGVLVITPTRELALQIYEVCVTVGDFHKLKMGLVIGGKDLETENKILNEYNVVICTPGRLLQHLDQNPLMDTTNLQMLVLDEADRILDMGFQQEMNAILDHLPQNRQTLLFSATQTRSVKDLARLSLKNPVYVSVHEHAKYATPSGLEQSYIVCELPKKMDFLWSFIKNHKKQKILIFMASCKQVKYTFEVFCRMKPGVSLTALYGDLHQLKRIERYKDFCRKNHVVMFATDIASRGLDFPNVNWVVQMDCPEDVNTYIHRAGRTARYQNGGNSLLVLLPSEKEAMLQHLESKKIPISEIVVHPSKIVSVQRKIELLCARDDLLVESAQRAYKAYLKSVILMKDKSVFDVNLCCDTELLQAYARSLGLMQAPRHRFVQRRVKGAMKSEPKSAEETASPTLQSVSEECKKANVFGATLSDDSDDDGYCDKGSISCPKIQVKEKANVKSKKPVTEEALTKMVIKSKIKPNMKVRFDENGEVTTCDRAEIEVKEDAKRSSEEPEGFSIERAAQLIGTEDEVVDKPLFHNKIKQKHMEKRLKLRSKRRQDNETPLAELEGSEEDKDEAGSDSSQSSDEGPAPKRRRFSDESEIDSENSDDDDDDDDDGISQNKQQETDMAEDELLALQLLENT